MSLFAASEQGAWYDPSDLSTMYTTSAGTTPVTAVEQAVGLILDKSKGLVLGDDIKSAGAVGLIGTATAATYNTSTGVGTATRVDASNQSYVEWSGLLPAGRFYAVKIQNTGANQLYVRQAIGGTIIATLAAGADVTVYAPSSGTGTITIAAASSGTTASFTISSVRSFSGNHAIQPTDASRPTLRARYNLLTYSEQFDNAAWTKTSVTVSANAGVAPDGTTTADGMLASTTGASLKRFSVANTVVSGSQYTESVFAKAGLATTVVLRFDSSNFVTFDLSAVTATVTGTYYSSASITSVGSGWYRCAAVLTTTSTSHTTWIGPSDLNTTYASTIDPILLLWGAQLLTATDSTALANRYQRIAASTDYDTVGFPVYLAFDGSDDSLYTSSINFSATDKMTVFAGVTKLSDATGGMIYEQSGGGAFYLYAPGTTDYQWRSGGTLNSNVNSTTFAAPTTNVVTGIGDISGDVSTIRVDSTQSNTSSADQGTGNYANAIFYIGRRNNSSLPFNGRIAQLIVRGAQSSAALITQTERWIASKQGRVI